MSANRVLKRFAHTVRVGVAILVSLQVSLVGTLANAAPQDQEPATKFPVKHVIIIVGENRTFDHIFATYKPKKGESVDNLLSKGIVNKDGTPGPKFKNAWQCLADASQETSFDLSPSNKTLFSPLPAPLTGGPSLLRRRNAHPFHGDLAVHRGRAHFAQISRPCVDYQVHRAQLEPRYHQWTQPRQFT
jgi:hypothetical protein